MLFLNKMAAPKDAIVVSEEAYAVQVRFFSPNCLPGYRELRQEASPCNCKQLPRRLRCSRTLNQSLLS